MRCVPDVRDRRVSMILAAVIGFYFPGTSVCTSSVRDSLLLTTFGHHQMVFAVLVLATISPTCYLLQLSYYSECIPAAIKSTIGLGFGIWNLKLGQYFL
jgi:hypothetical protein